MKIETEEQYEKALEQIEVILTDRQYCDFKLDELSNGLEDYEDEHHPIEENPKEIQELIDFMRWYQSNDKYKAYDPVEAAEEYLKFKES